MQKDAAYMKLIEEISLNAWPSHKIELYDGWLIRFSHNYTYRTNSVEQVGDSLIPIEEKIAYCEAQYRNYHTPSNFKINPLLDSSFDKLLEEKGYEIRHTTEVMTMPMKIFHPYPAESLEYEYYGRNSNLPSSVFYPGHIAVQLRDRITDEWIESLFRLSGTTGPTLRRIVPSMFKAIPKETIVACIENRRPHGCLRSWNSRPRTHRTVCDLCRCKLPQKAFRTCDLQFDPDRGSEKRCDTRLPSGCERKYCR